MGSRTHRAVLSRGVDDAGPPLLDAKVRRRPARDLELRVARAVAPADAIVVLEQDLPVDGDEHRAEGLVAVLERAFCEVDGADQEAAVLVGDGHGATLGRFSRDG